jgi:hypothetical protein
MRNRKQIPFDLSAAVGGAALAYFLDPQNGRRAALTRRDQALSLARHATKRARKLVHHASSDATGTSAPRRSRSPPGHGRRARRRHPRGQVESIVFRNHDVPKGQININAENGVVFLRGQVERPELVERFEKRVRKVGGVKDVETSCTRPSTRRRLIGRNRGPQASGRHDGNRRASVPPIQRAS